MSHTKIATQTLRTIRGELVKKAELEKEAQQLREEVAVLKDTMELVAQGYLDPAVAQEKVGEFLDDPTKLQILKMAHDLTPGLNKIGTAVDGDTKTTGSSSPELRFQSRVEGLVDGMDDASL